MLKTLATVTEAVSDWQGLQLKTILLIIGLVAGLASAYISSKSLLDVPNKLIQHEATTREMATAINRQLCIQVADHRKVDWQLCYTNPGYVIPEAVTIGSH